MNPRGRIVFASIARAGWLAALILLLPGFALSQPTPGVISSATLTAVDRVQLTTKLKAITGWSDLEFDNESRLRRSDRNAVGGSSAARSLLDRAISGQHIILIEDASRDREVVFARARTARWKSFASSGSPVFVIQIDFADFEHVSGDQLALQAFDVGWVVLHEVDHIVNNSLDSDRADEAGECENHINVMRRECNLPERGDYFFTFLPIATDSVFAARFVRLAFERDFAGARRKYWLLWDATLVGGVHSRELASLR
ncbi:MAG TPA: hypothetical protein VIT88_07495 [Pyrinomonadaceae bacterium]